MSCEHCQDHLIDFAHRELDDAAYAAIAGHLAQCPECALEYCRLQADLQGIAAAHTDDAPRPEVAAALRERVAVAMTPPLWRRWTSPLLRPIPIYGAVLAAALPLVVWLAVALRASQPPSPPTAVSNDPTITHYDATAVPRAHRDVL